MRLSARESNLIVRFASTLSTKPSLLNGTELSVFFQIMSRTILWGKLIEEIPVRHMRDGLYVGCTIGNGVDRHHIYNARKGLIDKGFVIQTDKDCYMINAPGILRVALATIAPELQTNQKILKITEQMLDLITRMEAWMRERKIRIRTTSKSLDKIEQDVKTIEKQKLQARKRKGGKEQAWALFQTWIDEYIEEYWPDEEVKQSKNWTGKTRGQAKNWLKSFDETGGNAREWIRQAIERWPSVASACRDQYGRPAPVSTHYVRFSDLYTRREEIERILAELKDRPRIRLVYDCEREAANE